MTLLEWGALGELIGGIAIIASLIYVGRQLQQSKSMSRSAVRQEFSAEANVWAMNIASSPSLAEAIGKVQLRDLDLEDATDQERIQIGYAIWGVVNQAHRAHEQWKEGNLTEHELKEMFGNADGITSSRYIVSLWPFICDSYPNDFNEWYERRYKLRGGE